MASFGLCSPVNRRDKGSGNMAGKQMEMTGAEMVIQALKDKIGRAHV